jgi:Cu+-exporting ATPase
MWGRMPSLGMVIAGLGVVVACNEGASPPAEVHLSISGMHCESCVSALTQGLEAVPGALEAGVSLDRACARVVVPADRARTIRPALVEAVTGLGYGAEWTKDPCPVAEVGGE